MAMSRDCKRALDRSLQQLCEDLDVDLVMPALLAEELFTDSDKQKLDAEPVHKKKVMDFVTILKRKGHRAFEVFVEALRSDEGSKHLADHLQAVYNGLHNAACSESNQVHMQATD